MAAKAEVQIMVDVSGLGSGVNLKDIFIDDTAPEVAIKSDYQVQETADVAEALNVGAVDTIHGVLLEAKTGDISVDTSYSVTFHEEILIREGTSQFFCPSGVVYIKNATALEQVAFSYIVYGVQS